MVEPGGGHTSKHTSVQARTRLAQAGGVPGQDVLSDLKGFPCLCPPSFFAALCPVTLCPSKLHSTTLYPVGLIPVRLTPVGLIPARLTPAGPTPGGLTSAGLTPLGLTPLGLTPAGLTPAPRAHIQHCIISLRICASLCRSVESGFPDYGLRDATGWGLGRAWATSGERAVTIRLAVVCCSDEKITASRPAPPSSPAAGNCGAYCLPCRLRPGY